MSLYFGSLAECATQERTVRDEAPGFCFQCMFLMDVCVDSLCLVVLYVTTFKELETAIPNCDNHMAWIVSLGIVKHEK